MGDRRTHAGTRSFEYARATTVAEAIGLLVCYGPDARATVTPSPHHPIGAKGVGECATVGSPAAIVNAVVDALAPLGVRHAEMPLTPANVWRTIQGRPFRTDLAVE
jgi:carbon-monoxide dehydrogenase large subunit